MKKQWSIALLTFSLLLQGCATAIVAGGLGAAVASNDRRTTGNLIDDKTLYFKLASAISKSISEEQKRQTNIDVSIFNGVVVLTGQASSKAVIANAGNIVRQHANVKRLFNQVRNTAPIPASSAGHDVWLKSKITTKLLLAKQLNGLHISVTVADSEAFLMGIVSKSEAEQASELVSNIDGVTRVIKAFEYTKVNN